MFINVLAEILPRLDPMNRITASVSLAAAAAASAAAGASSAASTTIPVPVHTNVTNAAPIGMASSTTLSPILPIGVAIAAAIIVGYLVYNSAARRRG